MEVGTKTSLNVQLFVRAPQVADNWFGLKALNEPELFWEVDTSPFPELAVASHGTSALIRLHLTRPLFVFLHRVVYQPVMRSKTLSGRSDNQPSFRVAEKIKNSAAPWGLAHLSLSREMMFEWMRKQSRTCDCFPCREGKVKRGNDNNVMRHRGCLEKTRGGGGSHCERLSTNAWDLQHVTFYYRVIFQSLHQQLFFFPHC